MTVLGSSLGLQALAKEILEKKLSELDMWLVEQLRYLSNDRESNLVELHNLEPRNTSLREEMRILESEMEAQKLFELLEDVKSIVEKHKSIVKGLELKLKVSACEKQQVTEETSSLRIQLLETSLLQDEIPDLKRSLNEVKFENKKLESSLHILSGDNEELKAEKILSMQEIPDMQRAIAELGDCRHDKVSLEEKLFRLEGDLTARKAIGAQDAELKMSLPG
ncbi:hypothetical protein Peur_017068 [Populus x canadensis]